MDPLMPMMDDFDHYLLQQQTMDDMLGIPEKTSLDNNTASMVGQ